MLITDKRMISIKRLHLLFRGYGSNRLPARTRDLSEAALLVLSTRIPHGYNALSGTAGVEAALVVGRRVVSLVSLR